MSSASPISPAAIVGRPSNNVDCMQYEFHFIELISPGAGLNGNNKQAGSVRWLTIKNLTLRRIGFAWAAFSESIDINYCGLFGFALNFSNCWWMLGIPRYYSISTPSHPWCRLCLPCRPCRPCRPSCPARPPPPPQIQPSNAETHMHSQYLSSHLFIYLLGGNVAPVLGFPFIFALFQSARPAYMRANIRNPRVQREAIRLMG